MNINETMLIQTVAGVLLAMLALFAFTAFRRAGDWPFFQKKPMTHAEQTMYFRLVKALPEYLVLVKIPLTSFLGVRKGYRGGHWMGRVSDAHIDFMICTRDATIVAAIDLEDKASDEPRRQAGNHAKDQALKAAGVKLVRWHVRSMPTDSAIREMLIQPVRYVEPLDAEQGSGRTTPNAARRLHRALSGSPASGVN